MCVCPLRRRRILLDLELHPQPSSPGTREIAYKDIDCAIEEIGDMCFVLGRADSVIYIVCHIYIVDSRSGICCVTGSEKRSIDVESSLRWPPLNIARGFELDRDVDEGQSIFGCFTKLMVCCKKILYGNSRRERSTRNHGSDEKHPQTGNGFCQRQPRLHAAQSGRGFEFGGVLYNLQLLHIRKTL